MDWLDQTLDRLRYPRLAVECDCGNMRGEGCNHVGIRNHWNFPPFAYLPHEDGVDEQYYGQSEDSGFFYQPKRHWALVGEITEVNFFIRPRVTLKTRYDEEVLVNFHLEDMDTPRFFYWSDLQKEGPACLCIFYANVRTFLDMNQGIRQENPNSVMLFPVSFDMLADEVECHALAHRSMSDDDSRVCFGCQRTPEKLLRCSRCKLALYCCRKCQALHWNKSHKKLCRYARMLSKLAALDFSLFERHVDWNFAPQNPMSFVDILFDFEEEDLLERRMGEMRVAALTEEEKPTGRINNMECAACGELKPQTAFSRSQLRKRRALARCRVCIAGHSS